MWGDTSSWQALVTPIERIVDLERFGAALLITSECAPAEKSWMTSQTTGPHLWGLDVAHHTQRYTYIIIYNYIYIYIHIYISVPNVY